MAGPWEKYGQTSTPSSGPWSKYATTTERAAQGATPVADAPDPYKQAAIERLNKDEAAGLYGGKDDYSGKFASGAGLGWYDEAQAAIRAGLGTVLHPLALIKDFLSAISMRKPMKMKNIVVAQNAQEL